ncbi:MAG TPA: hypothetical protein VIH57_04760, partial [Bacteroidales bacterium]
MRFRFRNIFCYLLLTVSLPNLASGQIFNVNADTVIRTSVITNDSSIYVYYSPSRDSLVARNPVTGPATFKWMMYDTTAQSFTLPLPNSIPDADSIVAGLPSGGYRVHINASGNDYYYVAWVYKDSLSVSIEKENLDDIRYNRYNCEYTDIRVFVKHTKFIYYNTKGIKQIQPGLIFNCSADPSLIPTPRDTSYWFRILKNMLPVEKAKFYVYVKDRYGAVSNQDVVNYTPIISKALFDTTDTHPVVDGKNSAPFTATFINNSKNTVLSTWFFGDNDSTKRKDTVRISHTYFATDSFRIRLITQSLDGCIDSTNMKITVSPGEIGKSGGTGGSNTWPDLPNCFKPGSTSYPTFKIYNISIRHFRFTVFSRWGRKIY